MKIIYENCVYVQKNDIGFLNQTDMPIPGSIYMKVFGNSGVTIIDNSNRFEFIEFTKPNEIEYFKNINWMIDYNDVCNLNEDEIIELGNKISKERNDIAQKYNAMSQEERKKNYNLFRECELLDFKMLSLRDIILHKQGKPSFTIPTPKKKKAKKKSIKKLLKEFKEK